MRVDLHMHTEYSADAQYPQSIDDKIPPASRPTGYHRHYRSSGFSAFERHARQP